MSKYLLAITIVMIMMNVSMAQYYEKNETKLYDDELPPEDLCHTECVMELYAKHCGNSTCVANFGTDAQLKGLCSEDCIAAIGGDPFHTCLNQHGVFTNEQTAIQEEFIVNIEGTFF